MAYMAMARKWRPISFEDMVGQEHISKTLQNAIEGGRLHHAFLFTGTRGVGKTTSARILARTLNCSGGNPLKPCGVCPHCLDMAGGHPMDVIEIDAASNTSVDNVRELLDSAQYPPMTGKYKIFIIDEVHMLSRGAFNALLKTLEEPPAHVIFIFATTEVNKVPQTILSRVQRFDFKRLTSAQIISRLKFICGQEGISADPESLSILAEKADGSMRDALTYFDQAYAFTGSDLRADAVRSVLGVPPNELYFSLMAAIGDHDIKSCFLIVEKACSIGVEFAPLLEGFAKFLRNVLYIRVQSATAESLNVSDELFAELSKAGPSLGNGDLLRLAKMLADTQGALRYSQNQRLLVETAFARMAWLDHLTDLRKVLANLNNPALEGELKKKVGESQTGAPVPETIEEVTIFDEGPLAPPPGYAFLDGLPAPKRYSRYEICAAWGEILRDIGDEGDLAFAAALQGTQLEAQDLEPTPFPLKLIFRSSGTPNADWSFNTFSSSKAFQTRLVEKLEALLGCPILLQVVQLKLEPEAAGRQKQTPYERDLEREPNLALLRELFQTEWVHSKLLPKERLREPAEEP